MNRTDGILTLNDGGKVLKLLKKYITECNADKNAEGADTKSAAKPRRAQKNSFPNLAGFCRFLGVSTSELEQFSEEHGEEYEKILTVLEDEALNAELSPTLLSAYLKKRLGYEGQRSRGSESQLQIKFEHDIYEDGG